MFPGKDIKEQRLHSTAYIPYSFYECRLPTAFLTVPIHWHSEFELDYVVRGSGEFLCGGERVRANEGEVLLVPPNRLHGASPGGQEELLYYALVFSPAMLGVNQQDRCTAESIRPVVNGAWTVRPHIGLDSPHYGEIRTSVRQIFACVLGEQPHPDLLLKSELLRLFWLLLTEEGRICENKAAPAAEEGIRPALEYMMENYQENITIEHLAHLSHLSKSYFMGYFKKAVGSGAIEYLAHLRIHAACEALATSEKKVSEIASGCGYSNLSNFNRQFKKLMGCTPAQYRKRAAPTSNK